MASLMAGLLPETQGVQFTARPVLRTRESLAVRTTSRIGRPTAIGGDYPVKAKTGNAAMSSIEIEAQLREKVRLKFDSLKQAFQTYDVDQNLSITKGEFRRVLESFCFPLTSEQYEAVLVKVQRNPNGTVRYQDFLEKFHGKDSGGNGSREKWMSGQQRFVHQPPTKEINMDVVERMVREKLSGNLKAVIKAMQLFDYNMDGKVQRHELRRVLENYCFKFTDQQFDKLWQRYDFHHTGTVNYKEFLQRLGVTPQRPNSKPGPGVPGALTWPAVTNHDKQQAGGLTDFHIQNQQQRDQQMLNQMTFTQIEMEFRKRMKTNYLNLKKAFMSFDKHLDGFISLDDLKAILTNFTIPMSDQLFSQLMERCGVKGSHKISWEAFLEKFQNPWMVGNGQTLPIKPNHKFFPIMETQKMMEADDIWYQLYRHVQSNYSSFKSAFLEFDVNRNGRITRKELRRIIEKFAFRLDEEQFRKMMVTLDPHHSNSISYHKFLDFFEEKETKEGHKWLNSCHRVNEQQQPAIMAWETIEDLLREKITEHWKTVAEAIIYYDHRAEGVISPVNLKRVIDHYVLPVSEEHFQHLLSRCESRSDGMVSYVEFLQGLDIDIIPGDINGLSTQINDSSELTEFQRQEGQRARQQMAEVHAFNRTGTMSAEEVITRLKDRLSQHHAGVRKAFLNFDKRGRGRISKKVFRQVLITFGIVMTDEQFNVLVSKLDFHGGFMSYSDFLASFDDPRPGGAGQDMMRTDNHHVNPIRGDEYGMSALEVESKLRAKLRENFADLRGAFYKFDDNHTGSLRKNNFRRMLDAFMLVMTDEEFEKLCSRMGISKDSRITYQEFLDRFEVRDTIDGHQWLNSVHMYNNVLPPKAFTAEEAHEMLKVKVHRQWSDLADAFLKMDKKTGKGLIRRQHLREVLYKFVMPMTSEEFKKLWARYDEEGKGYISHQDFLNKLGAEKFGPMDEGLSMTIIDESKRHLEEHNRAQQLKHEDITQKQASLGSAMTAEWVERQLRDRIRDHYIDFYSAFRKYDTKKRGWLSPTEIQKVLVDLNFFISDDEFDSLLDRLGLHSDRSRLDYSMFLKAFQDGRKSSYGDREGPQQDVSIEEHHGLHPVDAETKLHNKMRTQADAIGRAFAAFDKHDKGKISVQDFRRVLDLFCFKMSEPQWKHLKSKLRLVDNMVDYTTFLGQYGNTEQQDQERWLGILQESMKGRQGTQLMAVDEVQERLQEAVTAHYYNLDRDFADIDYARIGVVPKDDFREVLQKHVFRLTDDQFEKLWSSLPVNDFGNIDYKEFLQQFSGSGDAPPMSQPANEMVPPPEANPSQAIFGNRPQTSASTRAPSRLEEQRPATMQSLAMSRSMSRMSTPLVNADMAERRLKEVIFRNWKEIQRQCRHYDPANTGTIDIYDFRDIMSAFGVQMPPEDFRRIVTKFDLQENGTFSYAEFLRHFLLNLKQRENSSLLSRQKIHPPKMTIQPGVTSDRFYDAMMRLRSCVTDNWKEMRRTFRKLDEGATGVVDAVEFRRVLRQFNVNLSEDEFFHLMSYYDKNVGGCISYNDFLRAYLKS
ncbi:EF-hand calcium-binding domain-containing protein 6-like [Haliotis rubra]|uniref:EF-hand calcium-binding domain-containing protein 6-like n=1 Tax=Haliotis rubra TaxID=36100 RepID=UPI001EE500F5|nr:EF-hand calcium-binding domain-containing protein 6-like [Haliotis rubra]